MTNQELDQFIQKCNKLRQELDLAQSLLLDAKNEWNEMAKSVVKTLEAAQINEKD